MISEQEQKHIRIAVVEDSIHDRNLAQLSFKYLLNTTSTFQFELVLETYDPRQALRCVERGQVDMLLIDLRLSGDDEAGLRLLGQVKQRYPHIKCVVYTAFATIHSFKQTKLFGAEGYIDKSVPVFDSQRPTLVRCLESVATGERVYDPEWERKLAEFQSIEREISPAHIRVMQAKLDDEGLTDREVADKLGMSLNTFKSCLQEARDILHASNTPHLLSIAQQLGLIRRRPLQAQSSIAY